MLVWEKDPCFILLPCHLLYSMAGGHKIVCTGVKFKCCLILSKPYQQICLVILISLKKKKTKQNKTQFDLSTTYRLVVIEGKVKGQDFGSVGVKYVKMLQFC